VGPIALVLASSAREVWGIDDGETAIATAKQNARRNGLGNCRFLCGDVSGKLAELKGGIDRIDLLIANPPRKGLQAPALDVIETLGVRRMIYVSCSPQTQARDLDRLIRSGYVLRSLQPFDMFPQTDQVETVAVLERNPAQ
jgi:23S rRNA (uracil1939-C5)-methyltransferase